MKKKKKAQHLAEFEPATARSEGQCSISCGTTSALRDHCIHIERACQLHDAKMTKCR